MKQLCILLLVLLLLTGCAPKPDNGAPMPPAAEVPDGGSQILDFEDNPISDGSGWYGDLPKGLRPTVCVGGKLFRWTGMSKELQFDDQGGIYVIGNSDTVLPEGFSPIGELGSITEEIPTEELQLRAAFEAEATFYTNPDFPEVVYALMTTDWFENCYVRFVSDDLHENACIAWQGRQYNFDPGNDYCEELPEGCELIGNLHYIGADLLPVRDLETNRAGDNYGKYIEGREVYAVPGDDSKLYVYEHHYWAEGDYPTWIICPLW